MSEHLPHPPTTGTCMGCGVHPCQCYGYGTIPVPYLAPLTTMDIDRLARALERIADALEKKP